MPVSFDAIEKLGDTSKKLELTLEDGSSVTLDGFDRIGQVFDDDGSPLEVVTPDDMAKNEDGEFEDVGPTVELVIVSRDQKKYRIQKDKSMEKMYPNDTYFVALNQQGGRRNRRKSRITRKKRKSTRRTRKH